MGTTVVGSLVVRENRVKDIVAHAHVSAHLEDHSELERLNKQTERSFRTAQQTLRSPQNCSANKLRAHSKQLNKFCAPSELLNKQTERSFRTVLCMYVHAVSGGKVAVHELQIGEVFHALSDVQGKVTQHLYIGHLCKKQRRY